LLIILQNCSKNPDQSSNPVNSNTENNSSANISIRGTVVDSTLQPIPGVILSIVKENIQGTSNGDGTFLLSRSLAPRTGLMTDTLLLVRVMFEPRKIPLSKYQADLGQIILNRILINSSVTSNSDSLLKTILSFYTLSKWSDAAAYASEFINLYPDNPKISEVHFYNGRSILEMGDPLGARNELLSLMNNSALTPLKNWIQYYLGQTWYAQSTYDSAATWFTASLKAYPDSSSSDDALYYLGRSNFEIANYPNAQAEFKQLTTQFPTSTYLDGSQYFSVRCDYEIGKYDVAITAFQSFLANFPASIYSDNARYYLGRSYYQMNRFSDAVSQFNTLLLLSPSSIYAPNARLGIGDCWFQQGTADTSNYRKALIEYTSCLNNWPLSLTAPAATEGMGECYFYLGDYSSARSWLSKVAILYPSSIHIGASLYMMGRCDMMESLYANAIPWFTKILSTYSTSSKADNALYQRGRCHYHLNNYIAALADLISYRQNHATGVYADNTYYYTVRIYSKQGNCAQAKVEMGELQTRFPASSVLPSTLSYLQTNCP